MKTWSESKLANFLIRKCLYLLNSNAYYKKYWQKVYTCEIKLLWNQTQYNLYLMDNTFIGILDFSSFNFTLIHLEYMKKLRYELHRWIKSMFLVLLFAKTWISKSNSTPKVLFDSFWRCDKTIKVVIILKSVYVIIIAKRFGHISAWSKTLHTWKGHWRIILNTSIMARRRPSCYVPMTQEARFTKESYLYPTDERMARKL